MLCLRYPIDAERYIAAMRLEFGPDPAAEEAHREIVPLVNGAYEDGLRGEDGYPLSIKGELQAFAAASGIPIETVRENKLLPPLIEWVNRAYAQGQQEAQKGAAS